MYRYGINESHLEEFWQKEIGKCNYTVYKKNCELVDNCRVRTHEKYFIIEIDNEENNLLAKVICKKNLTKRIGARKVEEKIGHRYKIGNLVVTFQILK